MTRYHFNVEDGESMPDPEGVELPDLKAAQREAVLLSAALLNEHADKFWSGDEWRMHVTDDTGLILFSLTFFASRVTPAGPDADRRPSHAS